MSGPEAGSYLFIICVGVGVGYAWGVWRVWRQQRAMEHRMAELEREAVAIRALLGLPR